MCGKSARRRTRRRRVRALVASVRRGGRCGLCGTAEGLQFHHVKPESKRFTIGKAARYAPGVVLAELRKTAIVCDRCHRAIHRGEVDGAGLAPLEL